MHVFIHPTGNVKREAVSRSVAVDEDEVLVDTHSAASAAAADPLAAPGAGRARASRLALDVVSGVPFDLIAYVGLVTLGRMEPGEAAAVAGPLKLLHLARLYRVRWFFRYLEYDQNMSLLGVTVARNLMIVAYLAHWVACGFEGYARGAGFDPNVLVGTNPALFASVTGADRYVYSLYWAVTTLAGNEWNDTEGVDNMVQIAANAARAGVFLLFNLALGAYILGTLTLLVVKADERTGRYRDMSANLRAYSALNNLPQDLKDTMQEHLRLSFSSSDASDDQDALLTSSRLELFKQGVDIVTAGDSANELYMVVSGRVWMRSPLDTDSSMTGDNELAFWGEEDLIPAVAGGSRSPGSMHGSRDGPFSAVGGLTPVLGSPGECDDGGAGRGGFAVPYIGEEREAGVGETFGELSFFTEIPQMTTVRVSVSPQSGAAVPSTLHAP
ncbi:Potassium channel AKT1 [Monoraphidium neglectum]|uniref:Potassium channel AKT1 n=1 Tax=Monoraphidium neglectum TaxID=145388 RepID=A0A0D2JDX4_9CHLO|nr:Potassium channel AKT1 [Monoraphidium neglectum]KIY97752.1 Potassium channel AKT1 [Monoraphidium neglectum]|eukprot:XP_013896772.1 Potassium channel AKT1 [Monoraphidium neglectum]